MFEQVRPDFQLPSHNATCLKFQLETHQVKKRDTCKYKIDDMAEMKINVLGVTEVMANSSNNII